MDEGSEPTVDDLLDSTRSGALREFVGGERDSLATEKSDDGASGESAEHPDSDETSRPDGDADSGAGSATPAPTSGGIARVLLKELREGYVDGETKAALRAELEPGRSREVKIRHLQQQVGDFAAYAEAMEEFIDEHGPFDDAFGELQSEFRDLDGRTDSIRTSVDALSDEVDRIDGLESDLEALGDAQVDLGDDQADLGARIETIERELERVDERLDEFETFQDRLSGVFQNVGAGETDE